jgi:ADP-heptose:LPS heptosyltransferase
MTENKNWYPERFFEVSKRLRDIYHVVQLGRASDPSLDVDLDLRGKIRPRDAAAVLSSCSALICQVGFLMHAAAAVGTRAVVIYGGFEAPWESGYEQNINLFTDLPCSPCWLREPCPYDKECMQKIDVKSFLKSINAILSNK